MKCLRCGGIIGSRYRHDLVWCRCGHIAVDGGRNYAHLYDAALEEANDELFYEYPDGPRSEHLQTQFTVFLNSRLGWLRGDGPALQRLVGMPRAGRLPPVGILTVGGKGCLGYLSEVVLDDLALAPSATMILRGLVVRRQQGAP